MGLKNWLHTILLKPSGHHHRLSVMYLVSVCIPSQIYNLKTRAVGSNGWLLTINITWEKTLQLLQPGRIPAQCP